MPKAGRPSEYTEAIAEEICERLAMGDSIRTVCKPDHMPALATFFKWLRDYPDFLKQYTHAKQEAADAMAEDLLDIADDGTNDWMEVHRNGHTSWELNGEALQRSKLRVDTRKFLMAKMKPKKYGDKLDVSATIEHVQPLLGGNTKVILEGEIVQNTDNNTTDDIKAMIDQAKGMPKSRENTTLLQND